jgi:lipoprotein LprG
MRRPHCHLLVAAVALALVTGCTGDEGGDEPAPAERLAAAKQVIDDAASVSVQLETDELPDGVNGVLSAEGVGNHDPAFEGTIDISASGFAGETDVVAVDGQVWVTLPFTSAFVPVDAAEYGAPDPAELISTENGLSALLTEATDVEESGQRRDGEEVLTEITGTLSGDSIERLFPSADPDGSFDATFVLTEDDDLAAAELTGPFYEGAAPVTYTVEVEASDETVTITKP